MFGCKAVAIVVRPQRGLGACDDIKARSPANLSASNSHACFLLISHPSLLVHFCEQVIFAHLADVLGRDTVVDEVLGFESIPTNTPSLAYMFGTAALPLIFAGLCLDYRTGG